MAWRSLLLLAMVVGATAAGPEVQGSCQVCRSTMSFAIKINSTEHRQEYGELLRGFCEQYYPPTNDIQEGPCTVFVQGIFHLLNVTDPVTHCDDIGACTPQPSDDIYQYSRDGHRAVAQKDDNICNWCVNLLGWAKAFLADQRMLDDISRNEKSLCGYLSVIGEESFCSRYIKILASYLHSFDARENCVRLDFCKARNSRVTPAQGHLPSLADFSNFGIETAVTISPKQSSALASQGRRSPGCTLCKTIVGEMFRFLRQNKTEENIIKGLDGICKIVFPSKPKLDECESMVKAYTRELVELLIDETDPDVICILLQQCTLDSVPKPRQISQAGLPAVPVPATVPKFNDLAHLITSLDSTIGFKSARACVECKLFIQYLKDRLGNKQSQEEIKQWLLDNLCRELPGKNLVESCSSMVEEYSAVFFKALIGELNPQTACAELGVCRRGRFVQVLNIGGSSAASVSSKTLLTLVKPSGIRQASPTMTKEGRCVRCIDVVSHLDDYLATHKNNDKITWDKFCGYTKNVLIKDECMSIVNLHGTDIVQMVPTMESPRYLCKQIALC